MSSIEFEKSAIISSNILPASSCLTSPSGIPIVDVLSCLMICHGSQRICSFSFRSSDWIIQIDLSSSSLILLQLKYANETL